MKTSKTILCVDDNTFAPPNCNFVGFDFFEQTIQAAGVNQIAVMQKQLFVQNFRIIVKMIDSGCLNELDLLIMP